MNKDSNIPTVHNSANFGDITNTVIMPGDPMRAKYIAENYLENAVCFNRLRGTYGYTGTYKGKKISVMGSGMGIPSMAIYSYELFKFYGVERIIRIGSCGTLKECFDLTQLVIADNVYSESTFAKVFNGSLDNVINGSANLMKKVLHTAHELDMDIIKVNVKTSDCFYTENVNDTKGDTPAQIPQCDVVEMETYALFNVAKTLGKEAAAIFTVTDSLLDKGKNMPPELRERNLNEMIKLALEVGTGEN